MFDSNNNIEKLQGNNRNNFSNSININPNIDYKNEGDNKYYNKKINLNYFDNKNLLEELRAKYLPDYNTKYKNEKNLEGTMNQSDKNNNHNDASEDSIQAQKIINEDSSHLNPFQKNIENTSFMKKEEIKTNVENKKFKSEENIQLINIKNSIDNKEHFIKIENNENKENKNNINSINNNYKDKKENEIDINNNIKNNQIQINGNIKENNNNNKNNNNIRNKYYTEIISSNTFNLDSTFNPFSKTSSSIMNNYTNAQASNDININKNKEKKINANNKEIIINPKDKDHLSFTLKNIIKNSNSNLEFEQNSIHKVNKDINNENRYNFNNNDNKLYIPENIIDIQNKSNNQINDSQFQNSKISGNNLEKNNDEFKEFLLSENDRLKKEVKNYEELIRPLINYINNINRKFDQREINPKDIKTLVKSDNPSFYIKNLERNLFNSNEDITLQIEKMKEKINKMKKKEKHRHMHYHSTIINKSANLDKGINNIRIINLKKSLNNEDKKGRNYNYNDYGKGNYFYEDRSDKYFYNYYQNRSINCPACIIGNSNSERGFSPIICCHLNSGYYSSSDEIEKTEDDDNLSNTIKNNTL